MMDPVFLGVDLGSRGYRAAYVRAGELVTMPTPPGDLSWRGAVIAHPDGEAAPFGVRFTSVKHDLGSGLMLHHHGAPRLSEDILRGALLALRNTVHTYAGRDVLRAALAVPSRYPVASRAALRRIAAEVGLGTVALLDDCIAAALGHVWGQPRASTLLVFSMGYLGYECSLIRAAGQQVRELAHDARSGPSGREVDWRIMVELLGHRREVVGAHADRARPEYWLDLRARCSALKERLREAGRAELELPGALLGQGQSSPSLTAEALDELVGPLLEAPLQSVTRVQEEAGLTSEDIDEVLLIGGSTVLQALRRQMEARFPQKLIQAREGLLARGAALHAVRMEDPTAAVERGGPTSALPLGGVPRPDLGPIFAYVRHLADQGQGDRAVAFLEQLTMQARALLRPAADQKSTKPGGENG